MLYDMYPHYYYIYFNVTFCVFTTLHIVYIYILIRYFNAHITELEHIPGSKGPTRINKTNC